MRRLCHNLLLYIWCALLIGSLAWGAGTWHTVDELLRDLPDTQHHEGLYLLKMDDCQLTAVSADDRIFLVIVQAAKQEKAVNVAKQYLKTFPGRGGVVQPFVKGVPCAAVMYKPPYSKILPDHHPLRLLYRSGGSKERDSYQLAAWSAGQLTVRSEYDYTTNNGKNAKCAVEMQLNLTSPVLRAVELSPKGRIDDENLRFLALSTCSQAFTLEDPVDYLAPIKKLFPGANILFYSTSSGTCIVTKRKICYVGYHDSVQDILRNKQKRPKLTYPTQNQAWPAPKSETDTKPEPDTKPETNTTESPKPPPAEQPKPADSTPPPTQAQPRQELNIPPARALEVYLQFLREL